MAGIALMTVVSKTKALPSWALHPSRKHKGKAGEQTPSVASSSVSYHGKKKNEQQTGSDLNSLS